MNDWNTIRCAKSVISSNSSFCWIACFLGMIMNKKEKIIFPNTRHYDEQLFNIDTNIFCSIDVNLFSI